MIFARKSGIIGFYREDNAVRGGRSRLFRGGRGVHLPTKGSVKSYAILIGGVRTDRHGGLGENGL